MSLRWIKKGQTIFGVSGGVTFFEIACDPDGCFMLACKLPGAQPLPRRFDDAARVQAYAERQFADWLKLAGLRAVDTDAPVSHRRPLMAPTLIKSRIKRGHK
jgi:hypothetical protein